MAEGRNVTVDHHNGLFFIREQQVERIFSDNTSINRFVVSEAILKCIQLTWECHSTETQQDIWCKYRWDLHKESQSYIQEQERR